MKRIQRLRLFDWALVCLATIFLFTTLAGIYGGYLWSQPTFRYLSDTFEPLDGTICAGDTLDFEISVYFNGQGRSTLISGVITSPTGTVPVSRAIPPVMVAGVDGKPGEITFPYHVKIPEDLPPGDYLYRHSAQQPPNWIDQRFSVPFTVAEC